jgi:hypothetical protein
MTNTAHTPGDRYRNGNPIVSFHTDEDGEHETLIADVFDEHDWWIVAAPKLLAALFRVKRLAEKSGDDETDPFALLDLIAHDVRNALSSI